MQIKRSLKYWKMKNSKKCIKHSLASKSVLLLGFCREKITSSVRHNSKAFAAAFTHSIQKLIKTLRFVYNLKLVLCIIFVFVYLPATHNHWLTEHTFVVSEEIVAKGNVPHTPSHILIKTQQQQQQNTVPTFSRKETDTKSLQQEVSWCDNGQ